MNKPLTHDMLDVLYRIYAMTVAQDRESAPPQAFVPALPARSVDALVRRRYLARLGSGRLTNELFVTERGQGYVTGLIEAGDLGTMVFHSVLLRFDDIRDRTPKRTGGK